MVLVNFDNAPFRRLNSDLGIFFEDFTNMISQLRILAEFR